MKKIFSIFAVCFTLLATVSAQDKAIGLRLGAGTNYGGEISFQNAIGDANRLELDLGFMGNEDHNGVALTGIYQWVWNISDLGDGFGWYSGIGGGVRLFNGFGVGLNGQIGIEYTLPNIPLKFSLDTRPGWYFGNAYGFGYGAALGIRYLL